MLATRSASIHLNPLLLKAWHERLTVLFKLLVCKQYMDLILLLLAFSHTLDI